MLLQSTCFGTAQVGLVPCSWEGTYPVRDMTATELELT